MKFLVLTVTLVCSSFLYGQKIEFSEEAQKLVGVYRHVATFDSEWKEIDVKDSIAHSGFLISSDGLLEIIKLKKSEIKYLEDTDLDLLMEENLLRGIKICVDAKETCGFPSANQSAINSGLFYMDVKKYRYKFEDGFLFIQEGVVNESILYWYKFEKTTN